MSFSVNGFVVGQNASITLTDDKGNNFLLADFGHVIEFDSNSDDTLIKVKPITNGGRPVSRRIPHGWTGKFTLSKFNGLFSDYIALLDNEFYNTGRQRYATMICTVNNVDGSISQYTFTALVLHKPTFGTYRSDRDVELMCNFEAQELFSSAVAGGVGITGVLTASAGQLNSTTIT